MNGSANFQVVLIVNNLFVCSYINIYLVTERIAPHFIEVVNHLASRERYRIDLWQVSCWCLPSSGHSQCKWRHYELWKLVLKKRAKCKSFSNISACIKLIGLGATHVLLEVLNIFFACANVWVDFVDTLLNIWLLFESSSSEESSSTKFPNIDKTRLGSAFEGNHSIHNIFATALWEDHESICL